MFTPKGYEEESEVVEMLSCPSAEVSAEFALVREKLLQEGRDSLDAWKLVEGIHGQ